MAKNRFSIFDAMENAGRFSSNPANSGARDHEGKALYSGPVEFPRMVYDPKGKTRVTVPGTVEMTPYGPKEFGEQREIIWKMVSSQAEMNEALASGWHDHPAKAISASNEQETADAALQGRNPVLQEVPKISSAETISDLQEQLRKAQEALKLAEEASKVGAPKAEASPAVARDKLKTSLGADVKSAGLLA